MNRRTLSVAVLAVSALALVLAGCGSKSSSSTTATAAAAGTTAASGQATTLELAADPSGAFKFDKSSLSGKAGKLTLQMDNPSSVSHAIAVEGNGVDKSGQTVGQGGKSTVSFTLKAGTYTFYCPVDSHRAAGMQGTLTVK